MVRTIWELPNHWIKKHASKLKRNGSHLKRRCKVNVFSLKGPQPKHLTRLIYATLTDLETKTQLIGKHLKEKSSTLGSGTLEFNSIKMVFTIRNTNTGKTLLSLSTRDSEEVACLDSHLKFILPSLSEQAKPIKDGLRCTITVRQQVSATTNLLTTPSSKKLLKVRLCTKTWSALSSTTTNSIIRNSNLPIRNTGSSKAVEKHA